MARRPFDAIDRFLTVLHAAALALCAGVVVATGVAAAVAFPTMRDLDPSLSQFNAVDGHWMIAAGSVMIRVFSITTGIAGGCIAVAVLSYAALLLRTPRRQTLPVALRSLSLLFLLVVFVHFAAVVLPRMKKSFGQFLETARAADVEAAADFRSSFDQDHPTASRELGLIGTLSFFGAIMAATPLVNRRRRP